MGPRLLSSSPARSALARLLALLALAAGWLVLSAPPAPAAEPIAKRSVVDQLGVRGYWTAERMRAARPLELAAGQAGRPQTRRSHNFTRDEVDDPSQEPFPAHGKVFLTIRGGSAPGDYVCSGTALSSHNRSVVWTAGHCVFDERGGGFATNWMFAPAYKDGVTPFGKWPARALAATQQWRQRGNLRYDLGAAVVRRNPEQRPLTELIGGRDVAFNQPRNQTYRAFGYPAQPPFSGGRLHRCTSGLAGTDDPPGGSGPRTNAIGCDMTAGASGGGWVVGGAVLSVSSYSYCTGLPLLEACEDRLYGPYQGETAEALFSSVQGEEQRCAGRRVTRLGTPGDDVILAGDGRDVVAARRGGDEVEGRGGNDLICAGGGDDVIQGGPGADLIRAGGGRDRADAGPGRDRIVAGPGRDRIVATEGRNRVRCHRSGRDVVITNRGSRVTGSCARIVRR